MAKAAKTDVLAQPVGMEATLSEKGVKISIRSRFISALDRLIGGKADTKAASYEGEAEITRATTAARAHMIDEAGKSLAAQFKSDPELALAVLTGDFAEASRRYQNRLEITRMATDEILQLPKIENPDTSAECEELQLDEDWLNQFYTYAGSASSEDLKRAFARILAGEVVRPGTFSKRTLRSICEIDHEIALAFSELARYRDKNNISIARPDDKQYPYSNIIMLDDFGLILNVPGVGFNIPIDGINGTLINGKKILFIDLENIPAPLLPAPRVAIYSLTRFGRDLCSILPAEKDDLYLDIVISQIKKDRNVLKITKADIVEVLKEGKQVAFENDVVVYKSEQNDLENY